MGCGASAAARVVEPAPPPANKACKQLEELNAACDTLADALASKFSDRVLQDHYFVEDKEICSGNFSTVRHVIHKRTGEKYAVKSISLKWASRDSMKRAVRVGENELRIGAHRARRLDRSCGHADAPFVGRVHTGRHGHARR